MTHNIRLLFILAGIGSLLTGPLYPQAGTPDDFDFILEPKTTVKEGDEFPIDAILKARLAGVQGWSYGVTHDQDVLEVLSVTTDGTDTPGAIKDGFQDTRVITHDTAKVGWIQGVILAFQAAGGELPVEDRFVMAKSRYKVRNGALGAKSELSSSIAFTDKIAPVVGGQPVDVIVTFVPARGITPRVLTPAEVIVQAASVSLTLKLENAIPGRKLVANTTDTVDINIGLENNSASQVDAQGWSYGVKLDPAVLTVVSLVSGPSLALTNGGQGPDFRSYVCPVGCSPPPIQESANGSVKGFTVGVVISLDPPSDVISIPAQETRLLEVLKVKSAITLTPPAADRTTQIEFVSDIIPGDRPVETVIAVDNLSVTPATVPVTVTLTAQAAANRFKRGFSNPDSKFDIADGIWTIRVLFYQDGSFYCMDAADANDDGRVDLSDAIYTINYLLQPGKKAGDVLFSRPPPPYPGCGDDPTDDNNPSFPGGLPCDSPTPGC